MGRKGKQGGAQRQRIEGWMRERRKAGWSQERDTQEERGCSVAADQMIHDKLAQHADP